MGNMSPYCAMNNNPVSYSDPEGDLPFLAVVAIGAATGILSNGLVNISSDRSFFDGAGKAALWGGIGAAASAGVGAVFGASGAFGHEFLRAGAHAVTQGGIAVAQGGSFWQGAASGGIGSGISSGIAALGGTAGHQIVGGGIGGGIGSSMNGGNFWQGFGQGIAVGAFNHALHSGLNGKESGDPPTKQELKVWLAGEFSQNRISKIEYINAISLVDDGPWGLFSQVICNNKFDLAMAAFPVGKIGMLGRYFASLEQLSGFGKVIARGKNIDDLPRLIAKYGGRAGDWTKVVSKSTYVEKSGFKFSTHWYEKAGTRFEIKTVIGR
jgi:hypothetical protein